MAEKRSPKGKQRQRLVEIYPDPTDDEAEPDPYYALRQAQQTTRPGATRVDSEANRQYLMLANRLPAHLDDAGAQSEDDNEGAPMTNSYLNLHPDLAETDVEDLVGIESALEDATDVETDTGTGRPGPLRMPGKRRRGWKWALKGTAHDPKLDKDLQDKPPRMNKPKGRKRKAVDPGPEFRTKQAQATQAFVEGRLDDALEAARAAVHANPEIFIAHSLLSEILLAQGNTSDSLGALVTGAVVARNADTWIMCADRTLDYAEPDRTPESLQQAIFCYKQAIDLDKDSERSFQARISKMHIYLELGEYTKARRDCKLLVGMRPADLDLVRQMAELCAMTGDSFETDMARKSYEYALNAAFGDAYDLDEAALSTAWGHLNIYLELVDRSSAPIESLTVLKRHARRFLGRGEETFWDAYQADDREFDIDHMRRYEVIEYQHGLASRDRAKYGEALPLELRVKLGLFRLKLDQTHLPEALRHFEFLMQYREDVESLFDMFYLVATSMSTRGYAEHALPFYEAIQGMEDVLTDEFWLKLGGTLKILSRFEDAAACYQRACTINPLNLDAKVDLAHLYQGELKDNERAWRLVDDIIAMNKRDLLRREKLQTRPRQKGRMKSALRALQRGREHVEGLQSSSDDDDDAPEQSTKRRRGTDGNFIPSGRGTYGGFSLDNVDDPLDVDEDGLTFDVNNKARQQAERKAWRKKQLQEQKNIKSNERRLESLESAANKVTTNFETVERLWPQFNAGIDQDAIEEWLEAALTLYEIFRSVKAFYPARDKHKAFRGFLRLEPGEAKFMNELESWRRQLQQNGEDEVKGGEKDFTDFASAPKALDDSTPKDFYDIPFETWHHIFVDLALLYARRSRQAACYQIIDDGLFGANVFFHDQDILLTTQATSLCCSFIFNDSERLCFAARWFMNKHDLRTGSSFQLLSAVNRLSFGNSLWFSAGPTQKHMLRSIKTLDFHFMAPDVRKKFDWSLQLPSMRKRVEKYGEDEGHLDANALLTYGHMVGVANHSQSALPYFFRAFAVQPQNVTVNLSIAIMCCQNAMKRQTDNRQYGIHMGIAFAYRYYDLRTATGGALERQEAEFNVGRLWHMLGLTHLAIGCYERALELDEDIQTELSQQQGDRERIENFSRASAYALAQMFAITGNDEAAKHLTEKWLVL